MNSVLSTNPGDNQGVSVGIGATITTSGTGGVGVFAQSVGAAAASRATSAG